MFTLLVWIRDFRFVKVPPNIIPDATGEPDDFCDELPLNHAFVVGIFLRCVMCVQSSAAVPDPVRTVKHSGLPVPRMTLAVFSRSGDV